MKKYILSALLLMAASLQTILAQGFRVYKSDGTVAQFSLRTDSIVFYDGLGSDEDFGPFTPVNQCIVGTWYRTATETVTFNEDGSTDYAEEATYKFLPYQGTVIIYNANGAPVNIIKVHDVTKNEIIVSTLGSNSFDVLTHTQPNPDPLPDETITVNGVTFTMVSVEGGTFQMGSIVGNNDEQPVHEVTLNSFFIGQTEVTQELWEAVMETNPSDFKGSKLPVEKVSWDVCQTFITKLNGLTGMTFRLPTEAEWEYAAHGGHKSQGYKYSGSNSLNDVAWYEDNSGNTPHNVATKAPNELGIYDMTGNVWEWCQDWYGSHYYSDSPMDNPTGPASGTWRVIRGGGWNGMAWYCRVTGRNYANHDVADNVMGFRLAM